MRLSIEARAIAMAGIHAVEPGSCVRKVIDVAPGRVSISGNRFYLARDARVHLVAFGKAAAAMIDAARASLGDTAGRGLAVVRSGNPRPRTSVDVLESDHPVPTRRSMRAGQRLLDLVAELPVDDVVLFLVSGGGSSLIEVPAEGLSLTDLARTDRALLRSGVPIQDMNRVRRHLSRIKGGGLVLAARPSRKVTLAISDVVGDRPEDIASGPTVGDPTTFSDAMAVVDRGAIRVPTAVRTRLVDGARGLHPENPAPGDPRLAGGTFHLVATNRTALRAAAVEARRRGYRTRTLRSALVGETAAVGRAFADRVRLSAQETRGACLLGGGETTVALGSSHGRGGRNQEFALAAAGVLAGVRSTCVLSIGTDGIDGPTDAAGGWADGATHSRATSLGLDLDQSLSRHDAYPALEALGGLVMTGPTGTNVMDLHVGLCAGRADTGGSSPRSAARSSRRRRS